MTLPIEISPKQLVTATAAIAITAYCAYRIWHGRRVAAIKAWENDDDNPANWYLKDPTKFSGKIE